MTDEASAGYMPPAADRACADYAEYPSFVPRPGIADFISHSSGLKTMPRKWIQRCVMIYFWK